MAGDQETHPSFPSRLEGRWIRLGRYRAFMDLVCCFPWMALTLAVPILDGSEKTEAAAAPTAPSLLTDF